MNVSGLERLPAGHQQLGVDDVPGVHHRFVLLRRALESQVGEGGRLAVREANNGFTWLFGI